MEKMFGSTCFHVILGDITTYDGDAVVNAANNHFWMGTGVAGAIKRVGGKTIEREAMGQGPKGVGESILTSGGDLKARYVIHAAVMGQDLVTSGDFIVRAMESALELCESSGIRRVAFPAFGTGVGGFPVDRCAQLMVRAAGNHVLSGRTSLTEVVFYLFSGNALNVFERALRNVASEKGL